MPYLIGADEAGYGPNLGPLAIAATVWRVPDGLAQCDLYEVLEETICRRGSDASPTRLLVADSKLLYKGGRGLDKLERGVLAMLGLLGLPTPTCNELWQFLAPEGGHPFDSLPWHEDWNPQLPIARERDDVDRISALLRQTCSATGIELVAIRVATVFPAPFNAAIAMHGNKADVLSRTALGVVGQCLRMCDTEPTTILCDKHGSRSRYRQLLELQFPALPIDVVCEKHTESIYRWGTEPARVEIQFRPGGEAFLPTALASMTAKYLRELAMRAFNAFWQERVDGLKPTAGYPVDAKRFKRDIADAQAALGIDDHLLWRDR